MLRNLQRMSPSSRRAWIEITLCWSAAAWTMVALLAEGVDRNIRIIGSIFNASVALLAEGVDRNINPLTGEHRLARRPPRGGRG